MLTGVYRPLLADVRPGDVTRRYHTRTEREGVGFWESGFRDTSSTWRSAGDPTLRGPCCAIMEWRSRWWYTPSVLGAQRLVMMVGGLR